MRIAPSLHRLGSGMVNAYLVEEAGGVTIVDAGVPGYWNELAAELDAMDGGDNRAEQGAVATPDGSRQLLG